MAYEKQSKKEADKFANVSIVDKNGKPHKVGGLAFYMDNMAQKAMNDFIEANPPKNGKPQKLPNLLIEMRDNVPNTTPVEL